jgi:uncharacterized membrane protein
VEIAILGVLAVLAIPVGLIVALVSLSTVKRQMEAVQRRLAEAEGRLARIEAQGAAAVVPLAAMPEGVPEGMPPVVPEAVGAEDRLAEGAAEGAGPDLGPFERSSVPVVAVQRAAKPRKPDLMERFGAWLRENWVYAVSGVSLALAGVFLVQYGMERGLLPPAMRVLVGIGFGLALIAVGERVRRRFGDGVGASTAYLPSIFSGAGLVSIFAALLAARQMYGLIGPEITFVGLIATAGGAIVLGWFHGPLLAALGLAGATLAPFLVGGNADAVDWLYGYFALVAAVGLAVDAIRRWAWVSVLAVGLAFAAGGLLRLGGGGAEGLMLMAVALVVLAVGVPGVRLMPDHAGPSALQACWAAAFGKGGLRPAFPVLLAAGVMAAAVSVLVLTPAGTMGLLPFVLLAGLGVGLCLWSARAPGVQDLALLAAVGFLARLSLEAVWGGPLFWAFMAELPPETAPPLTLSWLLMLGTALSVGFALRALRGAAQPVVMSLAAALTAPLAALAMEVLWPAAAVLGAYLWALHVMALAGVMVMLALRFARADGGELRRVAHFVLSALSLIALALFVVLSASALSLALAVLVVVAAALDRRLGLPEMALFAQAGVILLGWRMAVDPGLSWAFEAGIAGAVLAYVGPAAGFAAALWLLAGRGRAGTERAGAVAFLESGLALALVLLADVLILRGINGGPGGMLPEAHWSVALMALPWVGMALAQLYRVKLGGRMAVLRYALAAVSGGIGALGLLVAVVVLNPLWGGDLVRGPLGIDTLFVAYAVPGAVLLVAVTWLGHLPRALRAGLTGGGAGLVAVYAVLEIRRFWRGDDLGVPGTSQPELYSYTVALLILGAVLLWQAIARQSVPLRRVAMGVIGLTVAKVFLIDASGLSGLTRVFSFLALGLSLAGLAWLNRWAALRSGGETAER